MSTFRSLDFQQIDLTKPHTYTGWFLGVVVCPPAYARPDLGPILRVTILTDEGELYSTIAHPRNGAVTRVKGPRKIEIDVLPMKGDTQMCVFKFADEGEESPDFQSAILKSSLGEWDGSAAKVWGDERCVDLPPMPYATALEYATAGYDAQKRKPSPGGAFTLERAKEALKALPAKPTQKPAPQKPNKA